MGQSDRSLSDLAKHAAELADASPQATLDLARGRARLLAVDVDGHRRAASRKARARGLRWASVIAAAAMFVALFVVTRPAKPITFAVGGEQGAVGAWLAAPLAHALPIRFSEGSALELAAGGRARVTSIDANGAEISLERGSLRVAVVHRARTAWRVHAGPFLVNVIGTRFDASWDPASERFTVALREGAIVVAGPVVGDARAVRAGERITVSVASNALTVGSIDGELARETAHEAAPTATSTASLGPQDLPDVAPAPSVVAPRASASSATVAPSVEPAVAAPPAWRALALEAKYKESLAAAEADGFGSICGSASASDLRALADVARLGGSGARAQQAFEALLGRFPGTAEAGYAAFMSGRAAQDQAHDYAGAARWFTRYLREQPGGRFAEEASGRLVELTDKLGDPARAELAAQRYLASYPVGPHADYARRVLARAAP